MTPATAIVTADSEAHLQRVREMFAEYSALLRVLHADPCHSNLDEEAAGLPGAYGPPDGCLLLATVAGQAAGCVGLRKLGDGVCEMKRLFVRPQYRGLKLGRELTRAVIGRARDLGYERVRLDTMAAMTEAQALYRSLGFVPVPPYGPNPIPGAVHMELLLGPAAGTERQPP